MDLFTVEVWRNALELRVPLDRDGVYKKLICGRELVTKRRLCCNNFVHAVERLASDLDRENIRAFGRLHDPNLRPGLLLIKIDCLIGRLHIRKTANNIAALGLQCDRRHIVDLFLDDLDGAFDVKFTEALGCIGNSPALGVQEILLAFGADIFFKLPIRPQLATCGDLDDAFDKRTSECATGSIAQEILTNLDVGVVNAVFDEIVGDARRNFLHTFCGTSLCNRGKPALEDLLHNRSLGYGNLAEKRCDWPEEAGDRRSLCHADKAAKLLRCKLLLGRDLHTGSKLTLNCLCAGRSTKSHALRSSRCGASGLSCLESPDTLTGKRDTLRNTSTRHKE